MLANNLVFKKVHWAMGLDRCRNCLTGAAPITRETLEYFMSLRLPLYELYGMSESTGPHTISWENNFKIMSCGKVVNGCQTKLDKPDEDGNGEICFWGRHVFMGYLNETEKTEEALDQQGWLHSGDLGKHDKDNFLFITGEDKGYIDDNGYPTDELTPEALAFCQQRGVMATKASEIIASKEPAIYKAIQEGIELRPTPMPRGSRNLRYQLTAGSLFPENYGLEFSTEMESNFNKFV
ncbi:long-chain-fatty-acid--CoA ligase ACSBG2-like [Salvelinus alpinus]|uniref:long-chain-fatty-acid--CoA ligase ACSBG2-like n=1 Tax=Salvelinus alpinus TaxID=8036 RepID=UPI0039FDB139